MRFILLLALSTGVCAHILRLACKLEGQFFKSRSPIRVQSNDSVLIANKSTHACIADCLKSKTCKTINHNLEIKTCELNSVNATDPGAAVTPATSWSHFSTIWNRTKIGTNCITRSTCVMNNTDECRDVCSTRGYRCFCKNCYFGANCELYSANSKIALNEPLKSCLHLKELLPGAVSDYYYISWLSDYRKVYCDMKTDSGGWIMVGNLSYIPGVAKIVRFISDNNSLGTFADGDTIFTPKILRDFLFAVGFSEIRLYCKKNSPSSNTIHIKSSSSEVIDFVTNRTRIRPTCVGTFVRLPDDDSNQSKACTNTSKWFNENRWSNTNNISSQFPLTYRLITCLSCNSSFAFYPELSKYECDDNQARSNYNDIPGLWQYFVR